MPQESSHIATPAPQACVYLFPVPLSEGELNRVLPQYNISAVSGIRHFVVENVRSARRFLKKCDSSIDIDTLTFYELNRHTTPEETATYLAPLEQGYPIGIISEAGCPAIADPGADVVALAQQKGYPVVPLVGPSSIIMALMGSGFNGQSFAFAGYLPVNAAERSKKLKSMVHAISAQDQTQIFIETPYRNNKLIEELLRTLPTELKLCVASDITGEHESIITRSIDAWRKCNYNYDRIPTIFLLYR